MILTNLLLPSNRIKSAYYLILSTFHTSLEMTERNIKYFSLHLLYSKSSDGVKQK